MKASRSIAVLCVLVAASFASLAFAQREPDITGYYAERDGEFLRITRNGDVYQVLWRQKAGDWVGVAIRDDDRLAIGWHRADGANLGVSLYKIAKGKNGPTLTGGWSAYPGGGVVADSPTWSRKVD